MASSRQFMLPVEVVECWHSVLSPWGRPTFFANQPHGSNITIPLWDPGAICPSCLSWRGSPKGHIVKVIEGS